MLRVFITGANRGLGLEMARQYLERGDRVFAACRNPDEATELIALAARYPEHVSILKLEMSDPAEIEAAAEAAGAQVEGLDLLINNAAYYPHGERPENLAAETMLKTYQINCVGPMLMAQALFELLKKGRDPKIVNISSYLGSLTHRSGGGTYSYSSSKSALNMLSRALANDLKGSGIIVAPISPGWVRTDMGGSAAPLSTEESVSGLLQVIDGLSPADAGRYLQWDGDELPW